MASVGVMSHALSTRVSSTAQLALPPAMFVTLDTSHPPMLWLKAGDPENMLSKECSGLHVVIECSI